MTRPHLQGCKGLEITFAQGYNFDQAICPKQQTDR
jgi:hypothetical protein